MENIKIENLTFTYPGRTAPALEGVNLEIKEGEFVTVFGKSGCGKTTLLKCLKPEITPAGEINGRVVLPLQDTATQIGFVMQNPENQIVCDKVWHELAFAPENAGLPQNEIHSRVAEMASFFGISDWFYMDTAQLSGGQKQLLSLAAVMVMQPQVLVLDEPTSQLDPIAADEFLKTLKKINVELGTTVILSEHRLEEAVSLSDRLLALDEGRVLFYGSPRETAGAFKNHELSFLLPSPMRIFEASEGEGDCPINVKEGRIWLKKTGKKGIYRAAEKAEALEETAIKADKVWFRYEKNSDDVLKDFTLDVKRGEIYSLLGSNGVGKTTALKVIAGLTKCYSGKVTLKGKVVSLPQNPKMLFTEQTVEEDLLQMNEDISGVVEICKIGHLLNRHPYDLSGGEIQRTALAKALLAGPDILLLDEPTKGMDGCFKKSFEELLKNLKKKGKTVLMVSHDVEFCATVSDRCGLFFDGGVTSEGKPREFFSGMNFYTTAASRMSRGIIDGAVTVENIIEFMGGSLPRITPPKTETTQPAIIAQKAVKPGRYIVAVVSAAVFMLCMILQYVFKSLAIELELAMIISLSTMFIALAHGKKAEKPETYPAGKMNKKTAITALCVVIAAAITVTMGIYLLEDSRYYLISMLIIAETLVPFAVSFEKGRPGARKLVIIGVLCAIAVAGRAVFFMVSGFKPVLAIIIISAMAFGSETGFFVGAITPFVSNMFFGQGPWTPWQMFAFGIVGFIAGLLRDIGLLRRNKFALCVYGFVSALGLYGIVMNIGSVLMWQRYPTPELVISTLAMGVPFDLIHAAATVFFLWLMADPMLEKLDRVKIKYGIK